MINLGSHEIFSKMRYILLISLIIEALISVSVLAYINNSLSDLYSSGSEDAVVAVPSQASCISFSFDHRYVQYIQDGKLKIWDMNKNKQYKEIDEKSPIVYSYFLGDRNIITYFVKSDKSSSKSKPINIGHSKISLLVKTFNLDNKEISDYGTLDVNDFQKIDQVVYSSLTNVIYINISVDNNSHNIIYKLNVMKQKEIYESGKTIKNMVLLQNKDMLLYEDDQGSIYMDRNRLNIKDNKNLQLLGSDSDNFVYLMPYSGNELLKIYGQKVVNTIDLKEDSPDSVINNTNGIFLVYSNHILDITANSVKQITLDKSGTPIDIFDHTVYSLNNKNEINVESNAF